MVKPNLLLDIDGVCLNWEKGLLAFINTHAPNSSATKVLDEHAYDLSSRYGIDTNIANALIWDFHYDQSFASLEPLPGVTDAIQQLSKKYSLVAITACGIETEIVQSRTKNLEDCFGPVFENVYCVQGFNDKRNYLKQYQPSHWVEDHTNNAAMGLEYNHQCWLINAPYNQSNLIDPRIRRIDSLTDLCEIIL